MFSKFKAFLILVLALLCLISIGFASWITSTDLVHKTLNSQIVVEDVLKYNDYITINEVDIFDIYATGFVDKEKNISNTGKIAANFTVELEKCFNKFTSVDKLNFSIILETSNNTNLFKNMSLTSNIHLNVDNILYQPLLNMDDTSRKFTNTFGESFSNISFELAKGKDIVNVSLEYQFTLNDNTDFKDLYEMLNADSFSIAIRARFSVDA